MRLQQGRDRTAGGGGGDDDDGDGGGGAGAGAVQSDTTAVGRGGGVGATQWVVPDNKGKTAIDVALDLVDEAEAECERRLLEAESEHADALEELTVAHADSLAQHTAALEAVVALLVAERQQRCTVKVTATAAAGAPSTDAAIAAESNADGTPPRRMFSDGTMLAGGTWPSAGEDAGETKGLSVSDTLAATRDVMPAMTATDDALISLDALVAGIKSPTTKSKSSGAEDAMVAAGAAEEGVPPP